MLGQKRPNHSKWMKENNPFKNKKHTNKTKIIIGLKAKERFKDLKNHPMYGKHHTQETIDKMKNWIPSQETKTLISLNHADFKGNKNPNWNNGSSFEEYGAEFNNI